MLRESEPSRDVVAHILFGDLEELVDQGIIVTRDAFFNGRPFLLRWSLLGDLHDIAWFVSRIRIVVFGGSGETEQLVIGLFFLESHEFLLVERPETLLVTFAMAVENITRARKLNEY